MTESEIQKGDEGTWLGFPSIWSGFSVQMSRVKALHALRTRDWRMYARSSANFTNAHSGRKSYR
jgi:hypothetical protein